MKKVVWSIPIRKRVRVLVETTGPHSYNIEDMICKKLDLELDYDGEFVQKWIDTEEEYKRVDYTIKLNDDEYPPKKKKVQEEEKEEEEEETGDWYDQDQLKEILQKAREKKETVDEKKKKDPVYCLVCKEDCSDRGYTIVRKDGQIGVECCGPDQEKRREEMTL